MRIACFSVGSRCSKAHRKNGKRVPLPVDLTSGDDTKAHVLVKASGFGIVFVDVHGVDAVMREGELQKGAPDAFASAVGMEKEHLELLPVHAHEARDLVALTRKNEMLGLGNGARDEGLDARQSARQ